jgi:CxxC motif-containing protein (DUF1111 family)
VRQISMNRRRKWFGLAILGVVALVIAWHFSPGIPVIFGPSASASTRQAGQDLFLHEWQQNDPLAQGDGLGPVFNGRSCVECHNQGGVGGGGSLAHNVVNFELITNDSESQLVTGTIHAAATSPALIESLDLLRRHNPVIPAVVRQAEGHCSYPVTISQEFDPLRTESVQTTALFGAGWVDRISSKAILSNRRGKMLDGIGRELNLDFEALPTGRPRILPDGRVGKFGWKAQFATLEEFVAAACSNEIGLGTPKSEQARPITMPEYPDVEPDLDRTQFRQLVAFVDTLPRPIEVVPQSDSDREQVERGKKVFTEIACVYCHVPDIGGVKGVYSDFLLHRLADQNPSGGGGYGGPPRPGRPLPKGRPDDDEWKTPALWGVADSAPYMHDGKAQTLEQAIMRHGRDAKTVREAYLKLHPDDKAALMGFLRTLKAPPDAIPTALK